ncbi:hypothetical protein AMATHDRAFT_4500 [Amanita thiersii Skay4041]|uniref:PNK FHA domain-containing protein n=1 Tax=Amanita thiersii Skay4041 TaxID=703135 RepID=A0A2A9NQ87_9AGAR|nr:hypothetical protein AMATHDRAFT_4500 [Amanita thiersii Skay4041]
MKRRPSPDALSEGSSKHIKQVHPFFNKRAPGEASTIAIDGPSAQFKWLKNLGEKQTCLHGTNLTPPSRPRVAAFDLDGTLIDSPFGHATTAEWKWWRSMVPGKLKELHDLGYSIVIVTNQLVKSRTITIWKQRVSSIAVALPDVPFHIFAAIARDQYRKPMPGIWYELENIFRQDGIEIGTRHPMNKSSSFFVGDAAGRQPDHASTDRKWAINAGVQFHTPEEYFLKLAINTNFVLPGFSVHSLPNLPLFTPTSSPLLPHSKDKSKEIILFVGFPCLGKSSLYERYFAPANYVHVNQDTLKTRPRCEAAARDALVRRSSCVVDNTNASRYTRQFYVDIAKEYNVPIRCFHFTGSLDLAWHNNLYRALNQPPSLAASKPKRELIPYAAFATYQKNFEEPTLDEGFSEIKKINWVFEGTDEERRYWSMWLQTDGK